jgi:hypothetical protein
MRDGQGNKLSPEEIDKVKAAAAKPGEASLNRVSVDPASAGKPAAANDKPQPAPVTAPKF